MGARVRKFLLAGLLLSPMACGDTLPTLPVQNLFPKCVAITAFAPYFVDGKAYVDADFKLLQSTGHCGCTSKVAAYSLLKSDGTTLFNARFDLTRSEKKRLYLEAAGAAKQSQMSLRVGCAGA